MLTSAVDCRFSLPSEAFRGVSEGGVCFESGVPSLLSMFCWDGTDTMDARLFDTSSIERR